MKDEAKDLFILSPSSFILRQLPLPPIAAGFALLTADLATAPWLTHAWPPFRGDEPAHRLSAHFSVVQTGGHSIECDAAHRLLKTIGA